MWINNLDCPGDRLIQVVLSNPCRVTLGRVVWQLVARRLWLIRRYRYVGVFNFDNHVIVALGAKTDTFRYFLTRCQLPSSRHCIWYRHDLVRLPSDRLRLHHSCWVVMINVQDIHLLRIGGVRNRYRFILHCCRDWQSINLLDTWRISIYRIWYISIPLACRPVTILNGTRDFIHIRRPG